MRLVHAAALSAAALLLASVASAQGLGDAAAREQQKRKTGEVPARPAKVFTESDLGGSNVQAAAPEPTVAGAEKPADPAAKPKTEAELEAEAAKEQQKVVDEWRAKLDEARRQEQQLRELADRLQLDLNDTSSLYTSGRARKMETLEDTKKKLADAQARLGELEDQGRRAGYR